MELSGPSAFHHTYFSPTLHPQPQFSGPFAQTPSLFWEPKTSPARRPYQHPPEPPSSLILQSLSQAQILPAAHEFRWNAHPALKLPLSLLTPWAPWAPGLLVYGSLVGSSRHLLSHQTLLNPLLNYTAPKLSQPYWSSLPLCPQEPMHSQASRFPVELGSVRDQDAQVGRLHRLALAGGPCWGMARLLRRGEVQSEKRTSQHHGATTSIDQSLTGCQGPMLSLLPAVCQNLW